MQRVQFKSNEISESMFESVKDMQTTDLIEHITHEQRQKFQMFKE